MLLKNANIQNMEEIGNNLCVVVGNIYISYYGAYEPNIRYHYNDMY